MDLFLGYALIYMYIGFLSGYAHRICYDDDVKVPIFLAGAGDILYGLAVYALQFFFAADLDLEPISAGSFCRKHFIRLFCP